MIRAMHLGAVGTYRYTETGLVKIYAIAACAALVARGMTGWARAPWRCGLAVSFLLVVFGGSAAAAPFAYIANSRSNTVSVIDTASNTVVGTPIPVGNGPEGVAVNPTGTRVYVTT